MTESVWTDTIESPRFGSLQDNISCDVLVIGGGMAGVLCAHFLNRLGFNTVLVEAKRLGGGVTKNTTAVITAQHDTLYQYFIKQSGAKNAKRYLQANLWAVNQYREMAQGIACDFEDKPSYMYSRTDRAKMQAEAHTVNSLGFGAVFTQRTALPFSVAGAVRFDGMAQFHPLKFLYALAKDLNVYENTFVNEIKGTTAFTDNAAIRAKHIVVATHFPFINRAGFYFMKLYQQRSFVIALENAPTLDGTYTDDAENGMYFRDYGNLLLVGGGDHRTGKSGGGFRAVRQFIKQYYPHTQEKYTFATQDCMSLDSIPYIGQYGKSMPNVYVATGFNEWGMTSSMIAAHIISDAIMGKPNPYAETFSSTRQILHTQLFVNAGETLVNFIQPTTKRCPHLGCALIYNKREHSWDCPCHGSRFDKNGKLIDNPSKRDAHV